jgi:DNA-binding Lrp family transcriptional regulator
MSVNAYILIQTEAGKAADVISQVSQLAGVSNAEALIGSYDVIVTAEADSIDQLGTMVVANVQVVPGITRTQTCQVVHLGRE